MGIARDDAEARRLVVLRNWEFFRAPLAGSCVQVSVAGYPDVLRKPLESNFVFKDS